MMSRGWIWDCISYVEIFASVVSMDSSCNLLQRQGLRDQRVRDMRWIRSQLVRYLPDPGALGVSSLNLSISGFRKRLDGSHSDSHP